MDPISDKLFKVIEAELPYREEAGGYTKYGGWYAENVGGSSVYKNAAWCDMFLAWAADQAGVAPYTGQFAYTPAHANWFKNQGAWTTEPEPGAFVFYNFTGARISHVGIVEKVADGKIHTIEANTDGVHLKRKIRDADSAVGYGLPRKVKVDGATFEQALAATQKPVPLNAVPLNAGEGTFLLAGAVIAAGLRPLRKSRRNQVKISPGTPKRSLLAGAVLAAALAVTAPAVALADTTQPYGVDVSHYDAGFDWGGDNLAFGIAKATEGDTFTDDTFARNWTQLKQHGLVRGAYHFGRPGSDPVRQADRFLAEVTKHELEQGDLLVLDLEVTDGRSTAEVNAWAKRWLEHVTRKSGVRPMFYSSWSFARTHGDGLGGYPLWVAHYGKEKGQVQAPGPWKEWVLHQYASTDHDHNVAGVSMEELRAMGYRGQPIG